MSILFYSNFIYPANHRFPRFRCASGFRGKRCEQKDVYENGMVWGHRVSRCVLGITHFPCWTNNLLWTKFCTERSQNLRKWTHLKQLTFYWNQLECFDNLINMCFLLTHNNRQLNVVTFENQKTLISYNAEVKFVKAIPMPRICKWKNLWNQVQSQ